MRSEASQWSLSPTQRRSLIEDVWEEAKKLTDAGFGNIKITVEKPKKGRGEMKCDRCGKEFLPGNRMDGTPNGVGFVLKGGRRVTLCADCIIDHERTLAWIKEQDDAE